MVAWNKMCESQTHGSFGLRSLIRLNQACNLKLGWDFLTSQESWAKILKARVIKSYGTIRHHIFSTLWFTIKIEYNTIKKLPLISWKRDFDQFLA